MSNGEKEQRGIPSEAELAEMSREELATLGMHHDDMELVQVDEPFPVKGTRAERRAERQVAGWFAMAAVAGLASVGVYVFWPFSYRPPGEENHTLYSLYTPVLGVTLALCALGLGFGVIAYSKKLRPEETAVQQRGEASRSSEFDRQTLAARLVDEAPDSEIARRSLIKRSAGLATGAFGLGLGVLALGGVVRNPWDGGDDAPLWQTGWASLTGEKVYLRYDRHELTLARPEDLAPGAIATVFPFQVSQLGDPEELRRAIKRADNPVMLVRLLPDQAEKVVKRQGQEDFNFGAYYAFSKICTHLGCPAAQYISKAAILQCPCHQSRFDLLAYAKPVFGPATRALPQLPITVDEQGYFVARSDFVEPIGPAFWELKG